MINCSAMPETLLESELFGHRKGSFTGAIQDKRGLFAEADGGTIFLDEIGEIPPSIQVKLLRVLQEGEVRMVGDTTAKHVDVRIVAATNRELAKLVSEGKFREDLFYRLNVIAINLPPLRDRAEDVPLLVCHLLKKYSEKVKKEVMSCSPEVITALQGYKWVGNIRELENVIERAVVLASGTNLQARDLPPRILGESFYLVSSVIEPDLAQYNYQEAKERAFTAFNRSYLTGLMRQVGGNISVAAEKAGMDRSNFKKILKRCSIEVDNYRKKD